MTPSDVERGLDISQRPSGSGALEIGLASTGAPRPETLTPTSVAQRNTARETAFVYDAPTVTDAKGATVPAQFAVSGDNVSIVVQDAKATYSLHFDSYIQTGKVLAGDPVSGCQYGWAVSLSHDGRRAVVAADALCQSNTIQSACPTSRIYDKNSCAWQYPEMPPFSLPGAKPPALIA